MAGGRGCCTVRSVQEGSSEAGTGLLATTAGHEYGPGRGWFVGLQAQGACSGYRGGIW
eukprot:CAMPEP_0173211998 /NCGR_PEP_ID=MMETSP1141-20130122/24546_1 /TAXON_ID=483371 /ORGANISM="non described non described, Strain CCMP2298" /LENGTH=57 /DNA_ID=CAMNT_0014138949 /DNA_START=506 /DNA_END=679 /DNA_ORIENTATION=+